MKLDLTLNAPTVEIKKHEFRQSTMRKIKTVLRSLRAGATVEKACKAAKMSRTTFYAWTDSRPRNMQEFERIRNDRIHAVEDANYTSALEGNVTAQIFFLTNRAPERWKDKRAVINNTNVNTVKVNDKASNETETREWERRIARELQSGDTKSELFSQ